MSKALWGTLTAVAVVLIGYAALAFWTGRSVPAGTHVAGIDIGSVSYTHLTLPTSDLV